MSFIIRRICTTCNNIHDEREYSQEQFNKIQKQFPEMTSITENNKTIYIKYGQYESLSCCFKGK